jgi:hypothetical protein
MELRQLEYFVAVAEEGQFTFDPFKFLIYAELTGAQIGPVE